MKIGILTFHSQLNYGGVLQCWALQKVLENLGHEVVIIDREFEHQVRSVCAIFNGWTVKIWIKFIIKLIIRRPDALRTVRYYRTVRFVHKHFHLTPYSFKKWEDAPKDLGIDLIVVGSDQVWNGIWNDLGVYLLEGAPDIPAIGYAVSLGMAKFPEQCLKRYMAASKRFSAVSVREDEARSLLATAGIMATHVLDPVLLCEWQIKNNSKVNGLVCYFIDPDELCDNAIKALKAFSAVTGLRVHIYLQEYCKVIEAGTIKIHYAAGPEEFFNALSSAEYILSDSFHALAFAAVFQRSVRIVMPSSANRRMMFSRIQEFSARYAESDLVVSSIPEALNDMLNNKIHFNKNRIDEDRAASLKWLSENIKVVA